MPKLAFDRRLKSMLSTVSRRELVVCLLLSPILGGCSGGADGTASIDYNWDIRPILSENCFKCHGADQKARKAGLRLDVPDAAIAELPESPGKYAIVPGAPDRSEIIRRISSTDEDERMPPSSEHKQLTSEQLETLRAWIDRGAAYKPHWSFISPEPQVAPTTAHEDRVHNDIDRFVFARLESEGLAPAPEASREVLINRVSLTLTGLPPTLDDVDAFVGDSRPDAYERLVDRLLDSPAYAEHMAAYWMDLARWSETDGFLDDHHDRVLWPWRDWVIKAFQDNMPFDKFGTTQLAGDLLPAATRDDVLATAFVRLGQRTTENGAIDAEYKAEYMIERTDNALGAAFLGLTVGCARCHDHKYDPIRQRDYYALGAFFNKNDEPGVYAPAMSAIQGGPTLSWPSEEGASRLADAEAAVQTRETAYLAARRQVEAAAQADAASLLRSPQSTLAARLDSVLKSDLAAHYTFDDARPASAEEFPPLRPKPTPPPEIVSLPRLDLPLAVLAQIATRNFNVKEMKFARSETPGVRPAVLASPILKPGAFGSALYFNDTNNGFLGRDVGWYERTQPFSFDFWFYAAKEYENVPVLNHRTEQNSGNNGYWLSIENGHLWVRLAHSPPANMIALRSSDAFPVGRWTHVTFTYDGSSKAEGTKLYIDGKLATTVVDHDTLTRSILPWGYADALDPFLGVAFGNRFREKAPVGAGLDELRVFNRSISSVEVAFLHDRTELLAHADQWKPQLEALLAETSPSVRSARQVLTAAREEQNKIITVVPEVLVMRDAVNPASTHVLERGVYNAPRDAVEPRGLESVLKWDESLPPNRLGLAQWVFDPKNPLTARVFVNRMWQLHFGRGLVETSEDFGLQGALPTHPALLDWLALDFIRSGWDVKRLHRQIVLSSTYRQSSYADERALDKDPRNELLSRGPRWRMSAEMVRDAALTVSGLLSTKVGGASATPYQPDGIWNPLISFYSYPPADKIPADEHHRRSLYTFIKRNALHPALKIFDVTNRTASTPRRRRSNTPLQALVLMNDPQYVEAYRQLAAVVLDGDEDDRRRINRLYRLGARSTPSEGLLEELLQYYRDEREQIAADPSRLDVLNVGATPVNASLNKVDLAAMTSVAAVVMNSPNAYTVY